MSHFSLGGLVVHPGRRVRDGYGRPLMGPVTDVGIEAVAKKCPSLTNVVLSSFCGKVTDAAIEALA